MRVVPMELVIEWGDGKSGYGSVHRKGCRDVEEPEDIGTASTMSEAKSVAENSGFWPNEDAEYDFAPCVKLPNK